MSNIKLKDHNWSTIGIYDDVQAKNQRVINDELVTDKADKSATVSTVTYDSTNHKLTKTINGTASDVMTVDTTPTDGSMNPITSDAAYDLKDAITNEIIYFYDQTVSVATSAQIMRIPSSGTNSKITTDTVVVECYFENSHKISGDVIWTSYDGYIAFTGTCSSATTANVVLGKKGN